MILKVFVARQESSLDTCYWVVGAWDEWSIDENTEGFVEEHQRHCKEHGESNVRVVNIEVPDGTMAQAFQVHTVKGLVHDADE